MKVNQSWMTRKSIEWWNKTITNQKYGIIGKKVCKVLESQLRESQLYSDSMQSQCSHFSSELVFEKCMTRWQFQGDHPAGGNGQKRVLRVEILKSQIATIFFEWNDYRADFWEFLPAGEISRLWPCRHAHQTWLTIWTFSSLACLLQCGAVCCGVLQCVAVCHSVLQCAAVCHSVPQCAAVCCSVLQCVAACCSALQCVAVLTIWVFSSLACLSRLPSFRYVTHPSPPLPPHPMRRSHDDSDYLGHQARRASPAPEKKRGKQETIKSQKPVRHSIYSVYSVFMFYFGGSCSSWMYIR